MIEIGRTSGESFTETFGEFLHRVRILRPSGEVESYRQVSDGLLLPAWESGKMVGYFVLSSGDIPNVGDVMECAYHYIIDRVFVGSFGIIKLELRREGRRHV